MQRWFWWFVGQLGGPSLDMWRALPLIVRILWLGPLVSQGWSSLGSREHLDIIVVVELVHRVHVAQWFSVSLEIHLSRHFLGI